MKIYFSPSTGKNCMEYSSQQRAKHTSTIFTEMVDHYQHFTKILPTSIHWDTMSFHSIIPDMETQPDSLSMPICQLFRMHSTKK